MPVIDQLSQCLITSIPCITLSVISGFIQVLKEFKDKYTAEIYGKKSYFSIGYTVVLLNKKPTKSKTISYLISTF